MGVFAIIILAMCCLLFSITLFWGAKQFFDMCYTVPGILFLGMGAVATIGFGYALIKAVSG